MAESLPAIIVTGASGFVGRNFLDAAKDAFTIYGLGRRSQQEAGIPEHENIRWIQADIANWTALKAVMRNIKRQGTVDYIYHLAGYYDFTYRDHPEYRRTNINGTRNILELAKWLCVKRFVFASSLAACEFPQPGAAVTEQTPANARFAYANSKRVGEEMVRDFSGFFSCSIVRLAAVFSEWCEYSPLYSMLSVWLSRSWRSRILGGRGASAVTYIHIDDLSAMVRKIIERSDALPPCATYLGSPDGCTSHAELYEMAGRFYWGRFRQPIRMPRSIAYPGLLAMRVLGGLTGNPPFERPWMIRYLDRRLTVNSGFTRKALDWAPRPRNAVARRLPFLIEKMKSFPEQWLMRNEAAMRRVSVRPNLTIFEELVLRRDSLLEQLIAAVLAPSAAARFAEYQRMDQQDLRRHFSIFLDLLLAAVRTGDRTLLLDYVDTVAPARAAGGFGPAELIAFFWTVNDLLLAQVRANPRLDGLHQEAYHYITLSLQLAADEVEFSYGELAQSDQLRRDAKAEAPSSRSTDDQLAAMITHLNLFYQLSGSNRPGGTPGSVHD